MLSLGATVQPEYIGRAASACIPIFHHSDDYLQFFSQDKTFPRSAILPSPVTQSNSSPNPQGPSTDRCSNRSSACVCFQYTLTPSQSLQTTEQPSKHYTDTGIRPCHRLGGSESPRGLTQHWQFYNSPKLFSLGAGLKTIPRKSSENALHPCVRHTPRWTLAFAP